MALEADFDALAYGRAVVVGSYSTCDKLGTPYCCSQDGVGTPPLLAQMSNLTLSKYLTVLWRIQQGCGRMTSTRGRRTHALVVAPRDPWRSRHCGHDPRLGCVGWHPEPLAPRPYGRNRCNVQRRPLAMEVSRPGMLQARNLLSGQLVSCCQKSLSTALIPSYFSHIFARVQ